MSESRHRILQMLADGKISVEEADRLLAAADKKTEPTAGEPEAGAEKKKPKYLYIKADSGKGGKKDRVNIKIPLGLIKTGMSLSSLIPGQAKNKVNAALGEKGIHLDLNNLTSESVDELLSSLHEINIDTDDGVDQVRIYCE